MGGWDCGCDERWVRLIERAHKHEGLSVWLERGAGMKGCKVGICVYKASWCRMDFASAGLRME